MRRKKLLRNLAIYTMVWNLLGIILGVFIGYVAFSVEAEEPAAQEIPIYTKVERNVEVLPPEILYAGRCKLTAYCTENYPHICNDGDSTRTATGTTPTVGRTCAVDPKVIPYGSEVIINGHTYIAEDCGGAIRGNRVDILFATHEEALNFGVQYADVSYKPKR